MTLTQLQNTLNNWFGIDNNTSATILITVIIFVIGLSFTEVLKSLNAIIQRKRIRNMCKINFKDLELGIKKQEKAYLKYIESLTFSNRRGFNFSEVEITPIVALQEIGFTKIYESYFTGIENIFINKNKLRAFKKLWSIIVVIPIWQEKIKSYSNQQLANYNEWNDKRNLSLRKFNKLCDAFIFDKEIDNSPDLELINFVNKIIQIRHEYTLQGDITNPETVENFWVQPMLKLNRVENQNPIVHELIDFLLTASHEYKNMVQILEIGKKQTFIFYLNFKCKAKQINIIGNKF